MGETQTLTLEQLKNPGCAADAASWMVQHTERMPVPFLARTQPAFAQTSRTIYNLPCMIYVEQAHIIWSAGLEGPIKEVWKQPVGRHGEHGPLVDFFRHMDVLLARDGDLLRLIFEELDVVVDVENVFVELGKVVEL